MSHRTKSFSLSDGSLLHRIIREIRYHEASRQVFAILFVLLVSALGEPGMVIYLAGIPLIALGILVRLWASGHVKKNKVLATDGPYAYVRHPLYVGNILLLVGYSISSGLWWSYLLMGFLIFLYYPPTIKYEDAKLHKIFGTQWEKWRGVTKALIPSMRPYSGKDVDEKGSWSFGKSMRDNGEPIIVAFLLGCLWYLYTQIS